MSLINRGFCIPKGKRPISLQLVIQIPIQNRESMTIPECKNPYKKHPVDSICNCPGADLYFLNPEYISIIFIDGPTSGNLP